MARDTCIHGRLECVASPQCLIDNGVPTEERHMSRFMAHDAPDGARMVFPNGEEFERIAGQWRSLNGGCTGITATWCPIHGDCSCPPDPDKFYLNDDGCPLHDSRSPHGEFHG